VLAGGGESVASRSRVSRWFVEFSRSSDILGIQWIDVVPARKEVSTMTKTFKRAAAIVELPPTPPAYVEVYETTIATYRCEGRSISSDCDGMPPGEPPDDHEHTGENPTPPIRINLSDTLDLTESIAVTGLTTA
jgi:hypothetical protein